jgi:hypothetical protein
VAIHYENYVKDQVGVGNGAGFVISNMGSSHLENKFFKFHRKNILHCQSILPNLLFVSQFARDCLCYFEL